MTFELSEDQKIVFDLTAKWIIGDGKEIVTENQDVSWILTIGGYAGTGKTTLLAQLVKEFSRYYRFAFCALSGRAASVLMRKLSEAGVHTSAVLTDPEHYCGTIHGLIYIPITDEVTGQVLNWQKIDNINKYTDIIIIDEASMVPSDIFNDLMSYNLPILAVGDHGQLPPIKSSFNLVKSPDLKLEKIHRQARENPVIRLAHHVREHGTIDRNMIDGQTIRTIDNSDNFAKELNEIVTKKSTDILDTAIICYKNKTRVEINKIARQFRYSNPNILLQNNEIVICLKNLKNTIPPIYNGFRGYIARLPIPSKNHYKCWIKFPSEHITYLGEINRWQFGYHKTFSNFDELSQFRCYIKSWSYIGPLFDFGYCLTCHKSQGSQWDNVIVNIEKPGPVSESTFKRWLYTAITRTTDKLSLVIK